MRAELILRAHMHRHITEHRTSNVCLRVTCSTGIEMLSEANGRTSATNNSRNCFNQFDYLFLSNMFSCRYSFLWSMLFLLTPPKLSDFVIAFYKVDSFFYNQLVWSLGFISCLFISVVILRRRCWQPYKVWMRLICIEFAHSRNKSVAMEEWMKTRNPNKIQ